MSTRSYRADSAIHSHGNALVSWRMPLVIMGLGVGVILLFAISLTVLLDGFQPSPEPVVINASFASRTDPTVPYATRLELPVAPQRAAVSPPAPQGN